MKIAVLHRYPPSQVIATNASFLEFLRVLAKKENSIYYITYKDKKERVQIENLSYKDLPFYFDRGNNKDKLIKTILWTFMVPFYVFLLNTKYKFDLVYCDDSVPYYGFLTKLLNPFTKVVIRLGDLQTGYFLADNHHTLFRFSLLLEKFMWNTVDGLVAISESFRRFLIKEGVENNKICVVEESINLDGFDQNGRAQSTSGKTILFHGALLKCKGLEVLIEAYKLLFEKDKTFKLIIAGGGEVEESVKKLASSLKLPVEFTGWYDHQKLVEIMRKSDVSVVMRSPNMANNFVVTTCLLENWKYKKPVVAPDLEAFRSIVTDGINGVLFRVGDSKDLAEKLEVLFLNRDKWDFLAEEGFKTAHKYFDHKLIALKMSKVLLDYTKGGK
ncbi:MAG: glycosyltransferase family 4 protein [Patescibacteria group bacterium]